jgi:hypothetical protein
VHTATSYERLLLELECELLRNERVDRDSEDTPSVWGKRLRLGARHVIDRRAYLAS